MGSTREGAWGRLLDRGTARAIMRQDGLLPPDAPAFSATIDADLAEYGFSVLRASLALKAAGGDDQFWQESFQRAASAFESLVRNGPLDAVDRGFYRVIAGAAYHLAGYSAIAFSLFNEHAADSTLATSNLAPSEDLLVRLILRDLDSLRAKTRTWLLDDAHSDGVLAASLEAEEIDVDEAVAVILNSTTCRALAYFDLALQTGDVALVETARSILTGGVRLAGNAGAVPLWWVTRLCRELIDDLWKHSLNATLPIEPPEGGERDYARLRRLFLSSLYMRRCAEIELWPSQREAARRSSDLSDDLVVALPTSAGKTRIAEIASLMTLSTQRRVLVVTPLRALSAQTERSFRKTFSPLGFTVSSLYGASGVSASDEDALRSKDIVISTPEKLDFALRNDPTLIDDVGLIVLDEGHLIGPTEREIRYETLVQRLLRRADQASRRIVCLSAVLPDGEQLDDLNAWIRSDADGSPVKSQWRPTRQRFGTLIWQGTAAKLNFDLDANGPFIARFVEQIGPRGGRRTPFPKDTKELTIAAAWNVARSGKRALIYSTQANWVEGYGERVIDLVDRGYLVPLLADTSAIRRAVAIGSEWLGEDHPAVKCLHLGVAVHHGKLPDPFLREIEALMATGILKVTIASPTVAQGLNLNASVLLVPYLVRAGKMISGEEFANVAGRAGRAFVDVEGLVVHVMFVADQWRLANWRDLVESAKARALRSGLIQIVGSIMSRLAMEGVFGREDAFEYLANSRDAWSADDEETEGDESATLSQLVEKLDIAVLGLIEALDADSDELPHLLDEALHSSLWARQISREVEEIQHKQRALLEARARLVWSNTTPTIRRGHFAMGVGLEAGLRLDALADELEELIDRADLAAIRGDEDELTETLIELARRLLVVRPFVPAGNHALPDGWEAILRAWVTGGDVNVIGLEGIGIIEDAFAYRLVWALEAIRMRRVALGWEPEIIDGGGAASLQTGVPQFSMSMLIRAGLPSRRAAISAIRLSGASFFDSQDMRRWLASDEITALTNTGAWPSPETAELWTQFCEGVINDRSERLHVDTSDWSPVDQEDFTPPPPGTYRVEFDDGDRQPWICTPDYRRIVPMRTKVRDLEPRIISARIREGNPAIRVQCISKERSMWYLDNP